MRYKNIVKEHILDTDAIDQLNDDIIEVGKVMDILDDIEVELQFIDDDLINAKDETDIEKVKEELRSLIKKLY